MTSVLEFVRYGALAGMGVISFAVVVLILLPVVGFAAAVMGKVFPVGLEVHRIKGIDKEDIDKIAKAVKEREVEDDGDCGD